MRLLLNLPEPMRRLQVLTARHLAGRALVSLQRAGVLHPEQGTALEHADRAQLERERVAVAGLLNDIEDALAFAPARASVPARVDADVTLTRPAAEIAAETRKVCAAFGALHRQAAALEEEEERQRELEHIATVLAGRQDLKAGDLDFSGSQLYSRVAILSRDEFETVGGRVEALSHRCELIESNDDVALFLVGKARLRPELDALVSRHGRFLSVPGGQMSLPELSASAARERTRLAADRSRVAAELTALARSELSNLLMLREALRAEQDRLAFVALACRAGHVTLFEGWVPESAEEEVAARLREEVGGVHVHSRAVLPGDNPPTRLRNPRLLRPFEVVIRLFALPRYGEWDPTPLVGYFFALFFGLMLGDAGYGLLLLLMARWVLPRLVADPEAEGFVQFRSLLTLCALAAIVLGVLQGSYLGDFPQRFFAAPELALARSLRDFYLDPMQFIVASLVIGLVHVNLGHLLMVVRGIRERQVHAVVGRLSLFLFQLAALPWILRLLRVDWLPLGDVAYAALAWLMGVAVLMVIVASLLERGAFLGSILWVFDISGILGDVMSYARLAGVGLATYFLAYSFNMMATLIAGMLPGGAAGLVLTGMVVGVILVMGHALNLALGAITCFVHALRLCFVEFLFKFYEGGGRPYLPFRLRQRRLLPVRAGADGGV